MSYDDGHQSHGHLDSGRCLDGSGRTWERMTDEEATLLRQRFAAARELPTPPVFHYDARGSVERRVDALARQLLLTTIALFILALSTVVHIAVTLVGVLS